VSGAATDPLAFLADGGEAGAIMRGRDWSASPLGHPSGWPQSLRSTVGLMLGSRLPMFVAWGPELGFLYNDSYAEILGDKHPAAMGARFDEVWEEIWPDISPLIDAALAGCAVFQEDMPLLMHRHGFDERTWFTFSYSPARDETGAISGMFCACQETTGRVLAEKQIASEGRRFADLFEQSPTFMAVLRGPDHLIELANPRYRELVRRDVVGRTVAEALPDAVEQGYLELLDQVYATGERYRSTGARYVARPSPNAEPSERFIDLVLQPIVDAGGSMAGILVQGVDVTDAHRAQTALRESEDHYRHAVELDPQTTWTSAPDGQLDSVNQRWFEWTGTPGLGSSYADGLHDADRQRTFDVWGRSVATGEPYDIEHRVKMRDGSYRWMHSRAYPRRDDAGAIVKWYGTTEDIHDRRTAQEGLREREAQLAAEAARQRFLLALSDRLREQADAQQVTIVAAASLGAELRVARAGYGEIDETQSTVSVARDWTARPDVPSLAGEARMLDAFGPDVIRELRAGRPLVVEDFRTDPRAGPDYARTWESIGTVALIVVPLLRGGQLRALLYLHEPEPRRWTPAEVELAESVAERTWDAVERASAESALREETRTLEALNRIGTALSGELDLERLVQMVTGAGVELTGARFGAFFYNILADDGEGFHLYTLSGADRSAFEGMGGVRATGVFAPTFRNEGVVRSEDILVDARYGRMGPHHGMPTGHLPVRSYMGVPVVSRSGEVLGGLLFGHPEPGRFTERHERLMVGVAAQAAIAIDNARLFQAAQAANETLEQRVAERTLELEEANDALRQSQKMEAVGQLTGGIAHDFNNMLAVVVGSLDLLNRRLAHDDPRARRYLEAAADGARRAAQLTQRLLAFSRQQPLRPEPVDANNLVAGMSDLLRHSLGPDIRFDAKLAPGLWRTHADPNQLENAILNLAVNARDAMPGGGSLTVETRNVERADRHGVSEHVAIAVTDTGSGMPPEVIAKAFDPFFTTKDVGKGTGLGLSQVYGFVKQSGGHVGIRSRPGEGTTVEIHLPRYAGAEPAEDAIDDAPELATGRRGETVLVVEDEPGVRQFSTDALVELGYRVLEADGAVAALRLLDAHPEVALLFTDVVMPEVNGVKLAEEARRRRPDLKVLFTTGYARDALSGAAAPGSGAETLGKPFTVEELAAKVRDALDAPEPATAA
jgi:PAS domain S-box-containing protein